MNATAQMKIIITPNWPDATPVEISLATAMPVSHINDEHLEYLFRQFNAVDGKEMISLFHFKMPSLSVGDTVQFIDSTNNTCKYRCAGCGWDNIS
jgi:hypothetical protein